MPRCITCSKQTTGKPPVFGHFSIKILWELLTGWQGIPTLSVFGVKERMSWYFTLSIVFSEFTAALLCVVLPLWHLCSSRADATISAHTPQRKFKAKVKAHCCRLIELYCRNAAKSKWRSKTETRSSWLGIGGIKGQVRTKGHESQGIVALTFLHFLCPQFILVRRCCSSQPPPPLSVSLWMTFVSALLWGTLCLHLFSLWLAFWGMTEDRSHLRPAD